MKKMYEKLNGSAYTAPVIDEMNAVDWDLKSGASLDPAPQKVGTTGDGPASEWEQSRKN